MTDPTEVLTAELVPVARELVAPGGGVLAAVAAPLLPVAERYAASQAAPTTKRTYRSTLRSFAMFVEGELGLPATVGVVTLDTVLDYTSWLQDVDEETDEPRCHPRTVAKQLSAIRGFARWLSMVPELRIDPRIQQIRVKAGPPPAPRALSPEQLGTLLAMPDRATMRGRRDRAILEVLARAGLRRSELCALRWDDVVEVPRWGDPRLRDAVAERPVDETAWALRVEHSKRGRSRLVPLARPVVAALEAWRATSASARTRSSQSRSRLFVTVTRARVSRTVGRWRPVRSARSSRPTPRPPICRPRCAARTCSGTRSAPRSPSAKASTSSPSWPATPTCGRQSATSP